MKMCVSCGELKENSEFYYRRRSCKPCVAAHVSEYQKSHRDKINAKRRETRVYVYNSEKSREYSKRYRDKYKDSLKIKDSAKILKKYKVNEYFIQDMMNRQRGCCPICGCSLVNPRSTKNYNIDHDHTTGRVRGLLCSSCNVGIGFLKDDIFILEKAIEYLESA